MKLMIESIQDTHEWEMAGLRAQIDKLQQQVDIYRRRYEECRDAVSALAVLKEVLDKL